MLRISQRFWENKAKPAACHELTQEDFVKQEVRIDLEPKEIKRKPQGVENRKKGGERERAAVNPRVGSTMRAEKGDSTLNGLRAWVRKD